MARERSLWDTTRDNLSPYGKFCRIEDRYTQGYPDVLYNINGHVGWIELKHLDAWPVRPSTAVNIPSFTLDQARFLLDWEQRGGASWLLLRVDRLYLLIAPWPASLLQGGRLTQGALLGQASVQGSPFPTGAILRHLLKKI